MIEFIAGLCFEIAERKSICSVSDGGVHSNNIIPYVMTQMLINMRSFALLLQFLVVVILNREYVVLSYKCTPFFLLQLICGLGIIKVNQLALSMVLCQ